MDRELQYRTSRISFPRRSDQLPKLLSPILSRQISLEFRSKSFKKSLKILGRKVISFKDNQERGLGFEDFKRRRRDFSIKGRIQEEIQDFQEDFKKIQEDQEKPSRLQDRGVLS